MVSVDFEYKLFDPCTLIALGLKGNVIAMLVDSEGPAYKVAYWADGKRNVEWLFSWEIMHR